jgi:hypothetical protein
MFLSSKLSSDHEPHLFYLIRHKKKIYKALRLLSITKILITAIDAVPLGRLWMEIDKSADGNCFGFSITVGARDTGRHRLSRHLRASRDL